MDRRRFRPSAEGLEGRSLLSGNIGGGLFGSTTTNPATYLPNTVATKNQRINNLPYFLEQIQPGRDLPTPLMGQIQNDLRPLIGVLSEPSNPVLVQFNNVVRQTIPNASLSAANAKALNTSFGLALLDTGANGQEVANLQADMNQLAQVDANSTNPTRLATDDYSTILQVAIGVGQPIPTPPIPTLATVDRYEGAPHKTINIHPRINGTYQADTQIDLIDVKSGAVIGSTVVNTNGQYTVTPLDPLPVGTYHLVVRADESGIQSPYSPILVLTVLPVHTTK